MKIQMKASVEVDLGVSEGNEELARLVARSYFAGIRAGTARLDPLVRETVLDPLSSWIGCVKTMRELGFAFNPSIAGVAKGAAKEAHGKGNGFRGSRQKNPQA